MFCGQNGFAWRHAVLITAIVLSLSLEHWINETHMTSVESQIHSWALGIYSWIALKSSQTTPQSLEIKQAGKGYIWKSLPDPIVCLILSFFFLLSFFSSLLSARLVISSGCVSSVVLANWRRDPSSSCCGEGDYFNPTPPAHLTIIIIIISPKRSIMCTDAAAAVSNAWPRAPIQSCFGSLLLIFVSFWMQEKKKVHVTGCVTAASQ